MQPRDRQAGVPARRRQRAAAGPDGSDRPAEGRRRRARRHPHAAAPRDSGDDGRGRAEVLAVRQARRRRRSTRWSACRWPRTSCSSPRCCCCRPAGWASQRAEQRAGDDRSAWAARAGPQTGGLTPRARRPMQAVAPPEARARAGAAAGRGHAGDGRAAPRRRRRSAAAPRRRSTRRAKPRRRHADDGAQPAARGQTVTGTRGQGFGLATGGAGGAGARARRRRTSAAREYLVTMHERIRATGRAGRGRSARRS